MDSKKKNNYLELLRFIFCIVIVIHHSGFVGDEDTSFLFTFGSLGADFFYLLTGYLAMCHVMNRQNEIDSIKEKMGYSLKYTIGKLKRVFPYAAVGSLSIYVLNTFWPENTLEIKDAVLGLQNIPFELLFVPMTGTIPIDLVSYRNTPMWYLSSMLIALPVVVYLAIKSKDIFKNYIVWFIPPMIMCWLVINMGGVVAWGAYAGIVYSGVLRAFADLLVGCAIYYGSKMLADKFSDKKAGFKVFVTIVEVLLLLSSLYYCHRLLSGHDQIFVIYVMALYISLCVSGISYTSKLPGDKIFGILGKLSMPVYCLHWGIYKYVAEFLQFLPYWTKVGITFGISIILSFVLLWIFEVLLKKKNADK